MQPPLASAGGTVVGFIVLIGIGGVWLAVKGNAYKSTRCMHCGHDSGRTGLQSPVCPACGLNRTIIKKKRARKH